MQLPPEWRPWVMVVGHFIVLLGPLSILLRLRPELRDRGRLGRAWFWLILLAFVPWFGPIVAIMVIRSLAGYDLKGEPPLAPAAPVTTTAPVRKAAPAEPFDPDRYRTVSAGTQSSSPSASATPVPAPPPAHDRADENGPEPREASPLPGPFQQRCKRSRGDLGRNASDPKVLAKAVDEAYGNGDVIAELIARDKFGAVSGDVTAALGEQLGEAVLDKVLDRNKGRLRVFLKRHPEVVAARKANLPKSGKIQLEINDLKQELLMLRFALRSGSSGYEANRINADQLEARIQALEIESARLRSQGQ